tara:strand:- start:84 stop:257 length:174 start_codon:yes stop_codon:yes gene_type:complete
MDKNTNSVIVLKLEDREECNILLQSLSKSKNKLGNVNESKLAKLIGTIQVIRESLSN